MPTTIKINRTHSIDINNIETLIKKGNNVFVQLKLGYPKYLKIKISLQQFFYRCLLSGMSKKNMKELQMKLGGLSNND